MRYLLICGLLAACQGSPEYGTTEQALVNISPANSDFGSSQVGVATAAKAISINPSAVGSTDSTVSSITAACPDFSIEADGLPAEVYKICNSTCVGPICQQNPTLNCTDFDYQSYTFYATFKPTVAGQVSCTVNIVIDGVNRTTTLTGTGQLPPLSSAISPASMAFGQVHVGGASSPVSFSVQNTGGQVISVANVSVPAGYQVTAPGAFDVAVGGTGTYQVTCHPTSTATLGGALTFTTNDPSHPSVSIPLSCTGTDGALTLTPSPFAFPTLRVGDPATQLNIDIKNSGTAALTVAGVSVTGAQFSLPGGSMVATLNPNESVSVAVAYDPSIEGDANGVLTATFEGSKTVAASLSGSAQVASMALTPDGAVDLGPVCAGQSKSQDFAVIANAAGPFKITDLSMPDAPFSVGGLSLPASVAGSGGSMAMFQVSAAPTDAGHMTGTLTVTTDIPGSTPHDVTLSVDALPAGVTATPAMLDFGSAPLLATTLGQSVHVSNCNTTATTWSNARIEGPDASEFAIVAPPDDSMIPSTASVNWLIVLTSHTVGEKSATFAVDTDDGSTVSVPLVGDGLGDGMGGGGGDDTTTPGKSSYYSCSVGGGMAAWPIGLAFLVLRRRRRCAR